MKANELLKKLGNTLLGKKMNTPAAGQYPGGLVKAVLPLVDKLGPIQLNQNWRN
jgi:hypothetical protein